MADDRGLLDAVLARAARPRPRRARRRARARRPPSPRRRRARRASASAVSRARRSGLDASRSTVADQARQRLRRLPRRACGRRGVSARLRVGVAARRQPRAAPATSWRRTSSFIESPRRVCRLTARARAARAPHARRSRRHALLVQHHAVGVARRAQRGIVRAHTQEQHRAGDLLEHVREVLGAHQRRAQRRERALAEQVRDDRLVQTRLCSASFTVTG